MATGDGKQIEFFVRIRIVKIRFDKFEKLPKGLRRRLKQASQQNLRVNRLWEQGKYRLAIPIARDVWQETSEALFLTSGYAYESPEEAEARFKGAEGYTYTRYANPTVSIFEERMDSVRVRLTGNLAQAWAFYSARFGDSTSVATWRGVDAFTVMSHDGRWRITSLAYASEP